MSGSASQILEGNDFFLMAKGNESRQFGEMLDRLVWSLNALLFQGAGCGIQRGVQS
jgi:hypothetical protein